MMFHYRRHRRRFCRQIDGILSEDVATLSTVCSKKLLPSVLGRITVRNSQSIPPLLSSQLKIELFLFPRKNRHQSRSILASTFKNPDPFRPILKVKKNKK